MLRITLTQEDSGDRGRCTGKVDLKHVKENNKENLIANEPVGSIQTQLDEQANVLDGSIQRLFDEQANRPAQQQIEEQRGPSLRHKTNTGPTSKASTSCYEPRKSQYE